MEINKCDHPEKEVYKCEKCGKLSHCGGICPFCNSGMMKRKETEWKIG